MTTREADGLSAEVESERTFVLVAYVLHLAGGILAVPSIAGVVVNYTKRGEADELFATHHSWMIRTFWWAVLWILLGWLTKLFYVGYAVLGLAWIWYLYRHVFGLIRLANGDPMARPLGHSMA